MKIEIWSDFACPFCYIGKRRLEQALENFQHREDVIIQYKSYELDPNATSNHDKTIHELLAHKYQIPIEQAIAMNEDIGAQATQVGLEFRFDTMKPVNTLDAHRLAKFAEANGKGKEMVERLLKAYFSESKHIADHETLISLGEEVDLCPKEIKQMLEGCKYTKMVRDEEDQAKQIGVQGVPFFVINEEYGVSGAQPSEVFLEILEKIWEESKQRKNIKVFTKNRETSFCTDDGCHIEETK